MKLDGYGYSPSLRGFFCSDVHADCVPDDIVQLSPDEYHGLMADQAAGMLIVVLEGRPVAVPPDPPTSEQVCRRLGAAVQQHIDGLAQSWGYDSAQSAVSYVGDPHPRFNAEALAVRAWRSACWVAAEGVLGGVLGGSQPVPDVAGLLAAMPAPPARPA